MMKVHVIKKDKEPREEDYEVRLDFNEAYYYWLCDQFPDLAKSFLGKMMRDSLGMPDDDIQEKKGQE